MTRKHINIKGVIMQEWETKLYKEFELEMSELGVDPDYWCDYWDEWKQDELDRMKGKNDED